MPRIAFVGDIHSDIDGMYRYLQKWEKSHDTKIDAVIQVGDFGIDLPEDWETKRTKALAISTFAPYWLGVKEAPFPTFICAGNHEGYGTVAVWDKNPKRIPNMTLMPDGDITDVLGIKVGCIRGNFSFKSYRNPERVHSARMNHAHSPKANHILKSSVDSLLSKGEFDVLVTHDCPEGMSPKYGQPPEDIARVMGLDQGEKVAGCPGFNQIHAVCKPKLHVFGHFHAYKVLKVTNPSVVCLHCFNYVPHEAVEVLEL